MPSIASRTRVNAVSDRSRGRRVSIVLSETDIREIDERVERRMSAVRSRFRSFSSGRNRNRALRLRVK